MILQDRIYTWVVLSVAVWLMSTSLARARAFRPFRTWVKSKSEYFGEGVSCQFCLSHWISVIVVYVADVQLIPNSHPLVTFVLSVAAVCGLGNLIARTIGQTPPNGIGHPDETVRLKFEGWKEAIQSVESSLESYPYVGGDTQIMAQVARLQGEAQARGYQNAINFVASQMRNGESN